MLDTTLKEQIAGHLARITQPVEIVATLDDSDAAREMRALLDDLASLSPQITLRARDPGSDPTSRSPSFSVGRAGAQPGIRFAGVPMGHEFTSLVLALLQTGGHPPKIDDAVIEQVKTLDGTYDFEVFISLTCQNCPEVVQALNLMAVLNPRVRATMIDGALFQAEVEAKQIMAVPAVYLNGQPFAQGRMTVGEILAKLDVNTGARWREMNVPGEREYRGRGVAYCPHCDGPLFKGKRVAVIGGGNSGVEAAIDLAGLVSHVTLIEFDTRLRADEVLQRKLRSLPNVRIVVSAQTTEVHGAGGKVTGLSYRDRGTGEAHRLELEGVFVQIGLLPNTEWLEGTVALSPRGEIEVDARGQTSLPGVFAAGDVTTVPYKQIVIAMGEGSKAALGAFDHLIRSSVPAEKVAA